MNDVEKLRGERNFRWRGADVSRIENLSDIVFALVLTLAAAQTVPRTFEELTSLWRDAISLAACFALIILIWRTHYVFFRRYDLQDSMVGVLNALLLFLVLVYIYPLKFMSDFVVDFFSGGFVDRAIVSDVLSVAEVPWLYLIYGGFFASVYGVFALLYGHALRRADDLGLDARERSFTRYEVEFSLGIIVLTAVLIVLAFVLPPVIAPFVGAFFSLIGVIGFISDSRAERRLKDD